MPKTIMRLDVEDTIVAIASARGPAWRGVLRISGCDVLQVIEKLVDSKVIKFDDDDNIRNLKKATSHAVKLFFDDLFVCDAELVVWPDKSSFTRQPSAELHMLGSTPIIEQTLELFIQQGCRLAMPGEFTMRAFLSGRLDLTQAEAVLGLIDARNERQFESSLGQLAGGIGGPIKEIKELMVFVLAEIEAGLDFADEDIEFVSNEQILASLIEAQTKLATTIQQLQQRKSNQDEVVVVLAGEPNAGKSSLFNALTEGKAIVSEVPGTTRDYLTAKVNWNGTCFRLVDTAGLDVDVSKANIGQLMEGQTISRLQNADIILVCREKGYMSREISSLIADSKVDSILFVNTKADLVLEADQNGDIWVCSHSGEGLDRLQNETVKLVDATYLNHSGVSATAVRVADSLAQAGKCLAAAKDAAQSGFGEELVAAEIRNGLEQLGIVVGTVYTDDILDVVFSQFCIGK